MRQVIEVRLENKPGALMRVVGILTAKGSNIESLFLIPDRLNEGTSKMTIAAEVELHLCRRVVQEMNRLVNVFVARDVTPVTGATCSPDIP